MTSRRAFLRSAAVASGAFFTQGITLSMPAVAKSAFEITKSKAEWKAILSPLQYAVLRQEKTEKPFSSKLLKEKRVGTYNCAGCSLPVYPSKTKFKSGTGWPSFWKPIKGAIGTKPDNTLFTTRTEVHCRRCGGHLGHVFNDGPKPTGKRHCLNGAALTFTPASA